MEMHVYEVRPRIDKRGVDLISDALPFGRLWYGEPDAIRQCNRLCQVFQPFTSRCVRRSWQRDRNARAHGRFQRAISGTRMTPVMQPGVSDQVGG